MDLTKAEEIKKWWQEYTEELYKKDLKDPDNKGGVIIHLQPDILECKVKWALGSIIMKKASNMSANLGNSAVSKGMEKVCFHSNPKEGQYQRMFKLPHNSVRKHLTRGFLCGVLDPSGTLWPLLIPEYSGIKRRGKPFLGLRNPGISYYSDKYPLPSYEKVIVCNSLFDRDCLLFCKSGMLIFIFAENNNSIYAHAMLVKTPLLHQSLGPHIFLSILSVFLSLSLCF